MPDLPDWVLKHKEKGVEIQERGEENYYAYKILISILTFATNNSLPKIVSKNSKSILQSGKI